MPSSLVRSISLYVVACSAMMNALCRHDTQSHDCNIDNGTTIFGGLCDHDGIGSITLVARIYTRTWMTHSTDRDIDIIPEASSGAGRYGTCISPEDLLRFRGSRRSKFYSWMATEILEEDMISKIRIDEEELSNPDSDDNKDVSQMYANALHNIFKRTTPQTSSIYEDLSTSTGNSGPIVGGRL
jgi:hypothetical protein